MVAFIVRDREVIIPNEDQELKKGDRVIVIAKASDGISQLEDIIG